MKIHLWSIYYEPVPMGIGPVAAMLAKQLQARGDDVTVIASHPHYPSPAWGPSFRPRRRVRDGIDVVELPVFTGRSRGWQRMLGELSYGAGQTIAALAPFKADVVIATVPSLMVVPGASIYSHTRRVPWVVWLHDIVSGAAAATGLLGEGPALRTVRRIERFAFRDADRVVTISKAFEKQLIAAGVPAAKVEQIYGGASLSLGKPRSGPVAGHSVLVIGNIGLTQNLAELARAFQRSAPLRELGAELRVTGDGVAAPQVHEVAAGGAVTMLGVVSAERLAGELDGARIALVSQHPDVRDFNLPSKITTYMARGVPVFAVVNPGTEAAELVASSGAGWVADSRDLDGACRRLAGLLADDAELARASMDCCL
ncbi:MAG: glycosyltransferase WbuB [Acidobacteria bacterium]|nr:MAG: glycosyltransferase WbuB [Acidobacteriota bacterium]